MSRPGLSLPVRFINWEIVQLSKLVEKPAAGRPGPTDDTQGSLISLTLRPRSDAATDIGQFTGTTVASELQVQSLPGIGIPAHALDWHGNVTIDGCAWDTMLIEPGDAGSDAAVIHGLQSAGVLKKRCRTAPKSEPVTTNKCISRLWSSRHSDDRSIRDWEVWIGLRLQ